MVLGECFKEQSNASLEQILITWHPLCHVGQADVLYKRFREEGMRL